MIVKHLSVLLTRDGLWYVGQCVEIDLASQAQSLFDLVEEMSRIVAAHVEAAVELGIEPFKIASAPASVKELYDLKPEFYSRWVKAADYTVYLNFRISL